MYSDNIHHHSLNFSQILHLFPLNSVSSFCFFNLQSNLYCPNILDQWYSTRAWLATRGQTLKENHSWQLSIANIPPPQGFVLFMLGLFCLDLKHILCVLSQSLCVHMCNFPILSKTLLVIICHHVLTIILLHFPPGGKELDRAVTFRTEPSTMLFFLF